MNKINFNKVVTHSGCAHADDLLACSILMTLNPRASIERRNPTEADLKDPMTVVVDVGGKLEPELNNYDHHQLRHDRCCSLSLILKALGIYEDAKALWPWLEQVEFQDNYGISAKGARHGLRPGETLGLIGPLPKLACDFFAVAPNRCKPMMMAFGKLLLDELHLRKSRIKYLEKRTPVIFNGYKLLDMRGKPSPKLCVSKVFGHNVIDFIIGEDASRKHWTLSSNVGGGSPPLTVLEDKPFIDYIHKGGHLAVISDQNVDPIRVVEEICQNAPAKI